MHKEREINERRGATDMHTRLAQLEQALIGSQSIETNAREFTRRILAMAECYPEEAAFTPESEREAHFSAAQRLAWSLRFERDPDALQTVIDGIGEIALQ